jgi:hypothetical protein
MDVTFCEYESYYEPTNDIGITLSPPEGEQEGGVIVEVFVWAQFLFLLQWVLMETIQFIVREEINNDSEGNNSCHGYIQSNVPSQDQESFMHEDPGTNLNSLSPNAPSSTLE